jgi:hypothetical protein
MSAACTELTAPIAAAAAQIKKSFIFMIHPMFLLELILEVTKSLYVAT